MRACYSQNAVLRKPLQLYLVYYVTTSNARGSVEMPGRGERELEGILYRASFVEPLDPACLLESLWEVLARVLLLQHSFMIGPTCMQVRKEAKCKISHSTYTPHLFHAYTFLQSEVNHNFTCVLLNNDVMLNSACVFPDYQN